MEQEKILNILQSSRHDWLNKIQLIKGYLTLGKFDLMEQYIDQIVNEAKNEANLSKLKLPNFALLIITKFWGELHFQLDYEVICHTPCKHVDDEKISSWLEQFFYLLNNALDPFFENSLHISIDSLDDCLTLLFHFEGGLKKDDELKQWMEQIQHGRSIKEVFTEREFIWKVYFQK